MLEQGFLRKSHECVDSALYRINLSYQSILLGTLTYVNPFESFILEHLKYFNDNNTESNHLDNDNYFILNHKKSPHKAGF